MEHLTPILNTFHFKPIIIGTAGDTRIKNYGDIDIDVRIKLDKKNILKIKKFIEKIKKTKNFFVLDIKIISGDKSYKFKDTNFPDEDIDRIKVDIAHLDDDALGYEIIFKEPDEKGQAISWKLLILEQIKKKQYMKALKRILSYLRATNGDSFLINKIINFINSPFGLSSKLLSQYTLLEEIKDKQDDKEVIQHIINIQKEIEDEIKKNIKLQPNSKLQQYKYEINREANKIIIELNLI